MSGIVGIYYPDKQPVEQKKLQQMLDILAHRGSDGVDIWCQNNIGLGHRMLWTTPESLVEKLPATNYTGNLVITADARIDNRDELIVTLKLNHTPPEKITDSQIILAAYEKWGEACPDKLLGDFAFAIWDLRQQKLFCARDHFGVKPFYYYYKPHHGLLFASEIKAIIGLTEVPLRINEVRIGDYLTSTSQDTAITSYQNIWRLPPAHTLTISDRDNPKLSRYWSLQPGEEIKYESDLEYAEKFREIFTEAVRCRLRSAFPVGSHLSGGLDSSSVTCVARDLLEQEGSQLHTFSNIFDRLYLAHTILKTPIPEDIWREINSALKVKLSREQICNFLFRRQLNLLVAIKWHLFNLQVFESLSDKLKYVSQTIKVNLKVNLINKFKR